LAEAGQAAAEKVARLMNAAAEVVAAEHLPGRVFLLTHCRLLWMQLLLALRLAVLAVRRVMAHKETRAVGQMSIFRLMKPKQARRFCKQEAAAQDNQAIPLAARVEAVAEALGRLAMREVEELAETLTYKVPHGEPI